MDNINDFSVIPLGTVSPYPKGNLKCPGFLVQNRGYNILLDCGSGVIGSFNISSYLNNLIVIISHLHNAHISDLSVLAAYTDFAHKMGKLERKVKILIPEKEEQTKYVYDYLKSITNNYWDIITYNENTSFKYGNMNVSFSVNPHDIKTYSTKIKCDNKILVYSSDTGYEFDHLDIFAERANLLICESTFLKDQKGDNNYHLSAFEAGMIAMAADVQKLLLTHFSPEVSKNEYVNEAKKMFENVEAAEEGKKLVLTKNSHEFPQLL